MRSTPARRPRRKPPPAAPRRACRRPRGRGARAPSATAVPVVSYVRLLASLTTVAPLDGGGAVRPEEARAARRDDHADRLPDGRRKGCIRPSGHTLLADQDLDERLVAHRLDDVDLAG